MSLFDLVLGPAGPGPARPGNRRNFGPPSPQTGPPSKVPTSSAFQVFWWAGAGSVANCGTELKQADSGFMEDHLELAPTEAKKRKLEALSNSLDGASCDYLRQLHDEWQTGRKLQTQTQVPLGVRRLHGDWRKYTSQERNVRTELWWSDGLAPGEDKNWHTERRGAYPNMASISTPILV